VDFSEARDLFEFFFQIPGPNCKIIDYGLISKKPRGLNAKCPKFDFPGIVFLKETRGLSPRVRGRERRRSMVDHGHRLGGGSSENDWR
jgi:hypothetical protein